MPNINATNYALLEFAEQNLDPIIATALRNSIQVVKEACKIASILERKNDEVLKAFESFKRTFLLTKDGRNECKEMLRVASIFLPLLWKTAETDTDIVSKEFASLLLQVQSAYEMLETMEKNLDMALKERK